MARRKREAADKKATELQAATREAVTKKGDARRMKEAEFQTTQLGGGMAVVASSSAPTWRPGSFGVAEDDQSNEDIEEALDEISEDESSEEEYEDDFEDDVYTEDDLYELDEELEGEHLRGGRADNVSHLPTVREEQDFTRVMCNYEQDLQRAENADRLLGASPPPAVASGSSALGRISSAGAPPPAAMTDVYTRASRLREELMRKMGPEIFQQAFDFLVRARRDNVDERHVRRELEALVGRETYKMYCFDVDQLVFQQTCLAQR